MKLSQRSHHSASRVFSSSLRTSTMALLAALALGSLASNALAQSAAQASHENQESQESVKTRKALFVIVDGISADTIESTYTPNLDAIAQSHGYTRSTVGGEIGTPSESPTISAVGYNSLLTGTWANKHNVYSNAIKAPNYDYWDIFRILKHARQDAYTALFSTWEDNRTGLLGEGLLQAGGHKLDYAFDGLEKDEQRFPHDKNSDYIEKIDSAVVADAARVLQARGPDLSWVYLQHTDDIGHRFGDSPEFTAAIELMDSKLGQLWRAVQKRQQEHNEDWIVIITTDHGRDAETGKHHGGQSARERSTWIVTNSAYTTDHFQQLPSIVDILPSILEHLAVEAPAAVSAEFDGASFIER